jgi:hypothetical protein
VTCRAARKTREDTYHSILWEKSTQPYVKNKGNGDRITFAVDVPDDLPVPEGGVNGRSIDWQVEGDGKLIHRGKELKLSRSWNIPVIKSDQQSRITAYVPSDFAENTAATNLEVARESAAMQIEAGEVDGLVTLISASGRSSRFSIVMTVVGAIFALIGAYILQFGWMPSLIFLGMGGFVAVFGLYLLGRKITVVIDPKERTAFKGRSWLDMPIYSRNIQYSDVSEFSISSTSSMNTGKTLVAYYAMYIQNNGKKVKIAEGIEGQDAAQALLDDLLRRLF